MTQTARIIATGPEDDKVATIFTARH